jgi:hypothetical protein
VCDPAKITIKKWEGDTEGEGGRGREKGSLEREE